MLTQATTRPMLHLDVIVMIPKDLDLLQIVMDETKLNSLLKATKGKFFGKTRPNQNSFLKDKGKS